MNNITITTSTKKTLNLTTPDGQHLGVVTVDPGDFAIVQRYSEASENLNKLCGKYAKQSGDLKKAAAAMKQLEAGVKEQVNYLLGYDATADIFGVLGALHMNDEGVFFFQQVINGVGAFISAEVANRTADKLTPEQLEKIEQATAKYKGR